jgi:hypothetical protein
MLKSLRLILGHPQLRLLSLMIFIQGSAYGSTLPYLSVTAIRDLGMSNGAYSALVFITSLTATTISVSLGIFSDLAGDRRKLVIAMALFGIVGYGSIFLYPVTIVFIVATALVIPFFQSVSSLLMAAVRAETTGFENNEAAAINATARAFMSASWVVMPALMGFALAKANTMLGAWGAASCCALTIFFAALFLMRKQPATNSAAPSGGFFSALGELAHPLMLARMISMAMLTGVIRLFSTLWPLIMTLNLHGSNGDVGMIAGLIALFEIPFMLLWASALKRWSILKILTMAGFIYASSMALVSFATAPWQIYALAIYGASGAAALLSMPLSYFQELFPGRPGLGTAFNPINSFVGNGLTALAFAAGTRYFTYSQTAWIGVGLALTGLAGLRLIDKRFANAAARI